MSNQEKGANDSQPNPTQTIKNELKPVDPGTTLTELNLWRLRKASRRDEAKKRGRSTPSTGSDEMPLDPVAWLKARPTANPEMEKIAQEDSQRYNERLAVLERTGNTEGAIRVGDKWIFLEDTGHLKRRRQDDEEKYAVEDGQSPKNPISRHTEGNSLFGLSNGDRRSPKRQRVETGSLFGSPTSRFSLFSPRPSSTDTSVLFAGKSTADIQKLPLSVVASGGLFGSSSGGLFGNTTMEKTTHPQQPKQSIFDPPPAQQRAATEDLASWLSKDQPAQQVKLNTTSGGLFGFGEMPKATSSRFNHPGSHNPTPTPAIQSQRAPIDLFASFYQPNPTPARNQNFDVQTLFPDPAQTERNLNPNPNPNAQPSLKAKMKNWSFSTFLDRVLEPRDADEITHPLDEDPPLDLENHLPANFPRYYTPKSAGHLNETGIYLSRARYLISLAGPPLRDMTYGIIVVPFGEEELVLCGHSRSCAGEEGNGDVGEDRDTDMEASRRLRELVEDDKANRPRGLGDVSWEGQPGDGEDGKEVEEE